MSVELRVLVPWAAMLPLGIALEKTSAASTLVSLFFSLLPANQPIIALALVYALTALLTEVVRNIATPLLMTQIAMAQRVTSLIPDSDLLGECVFQCSHMRQ